MTGQSKREFMLSSEQRMSLELEPIVIAGAGALGSVYAGLLAAAGIEVAVLAHGAHERALVTQPLELRLPGDTRRIPVPVLERATGRALILASRLFDSDGVLGRVDGMPALAFSVQNGIGKNEVLARRYGAETVIPGTSTVAAELIAPGIVQSVSLGRTYLHTDARVDVLAEVLGLAGLPVERVDGRVAEWSKLAQVTAIMGLQAVSRRFLHELMLSGDAAELARLICREVAALATASEGQLADLPGMLPVRTIAEGAGEDIASLLQAQGRQLVDAGATDRRTSLVRAVEAGRRSELDGIIGEVVRRAGAAGVPVPTVEAVWRLARLTGVKD